MKDSQANGEETTLIGGNPKPLHCVFLLLACVGCLGILRWKLSTLAAGGPQDHAMMAVYIFAMFLVCVLFIVTILWLVRPKQSLVISAWGIRTGLPAFPSEGVPWDQVRAIHCRDRFVVISLRDMSWHNARVGVFWRIFSAYPSLLCYGGPLCIHAGNFGLSAKELFKMLSDYASLDGEPRTTFDRQ